MTRLLERALQELANLPEADQDRIAHLILAELQAEADWDQSFRRSQDKLFRLAKAAREEVAKGDRAKERMSSFTRRSFSSDLRFARACAISN